jgi:BirA family biotin operon repressor/biotin-[acetyl-CoA-carboxylase] ligase
VGVDATLKWPNDVMVGERKVAGILAETVAGPPGPNAVHGRVVVVGLGLNVGWPAPETEGGAVPVPDDLRHATSLWRESGVRVDPSEVLDVLLAELGERLGELEGPDGRQRLHSAFREACGTLGREVTVSLPDETVRGTVLDITRDGHLLVDVGACIRTITAGDVVHLRGSS